MAGHVCQDEKIVTPLMAWNVWFVAVVKEPVKWWVGEFGHLVAVWV